MTSKETSLRILAKDYFNPEKTMASKTLAKEGIYIDIAGIEWEREWLEKFGEEKRKYLFGFEPLTQLIEQ